MYIVMYRLVLVVVLAVATDAFQTASPVSVRPTFRHRHSSLQLSAEPTARPELSRRQLSILPLLLPLLTLQQPAAAANVVAGCEPGLASNCFSSSAPPKGPADAFEEHYTPLWTFIKSKEAAIGDIMELANDFPDSFIGGPPVSVSQTADTITLKFKEINGGAGNPNCGPVVCGDEVMEMILSDGAVSVRASSNLGMRVALGSPRFVGDFKINSKRFNYFAINLEKKYEGWVSTKISPRTHNTYIGACKARSLGDKPPNDPWY